MKKIHAFTLLFVVFVCTPQALATEEKKRFPITPFVEPKANTYFDFVGELQASPFGETALRLFRKRDVDNHRAAPIPAMDLNELAHWHVVAYEGYESVLLQMKFAHEVYGKPDLPKEVTRRIQHRVLYPDNSSELVPFGEALLLYYGMLRLLDAELRTRQSHHSIAGRYMVRVTGNCPFDAGLVYFKQRDHFLEVVRDDQLLLVGVLGKTRAWFVANEQRHGTVTIESGLFGKSLRIDAPDAPSELYVGDFRSDGLDLSGEVYAKCRIVLRRTEP